MFLQHVRPYTMNATPDMATWIIALLGFLTLWLVFTKTDKPIWMGLGVGISIGIMYICFPNFTSITFSLTRSDIIRLGQVLPFLGSRISTS